MGREGGRKERERERERERKRETVDYSSLRIQCIRSSVLGAIDGAHAPAKIDISRSKR